MSQRTKPPIIAIVGPTGSGKTALSITLAQHFNGEVISADSRQVYRGLDIGTAKVTEEEMAGIRHHLLDVCDPTTVYTGADFVRDGNIAIADIESRGKLPIVAGGSFFYLDLLQGVIGAAAVPPNQELRSKLESTPLPELVAHLTNLDGETASRIDTANSRRVIRAIEIATALGTVPKAAQTQTHDWLTLGIDISLDDLTPRLHARVLSRLDAGMIEEVETLHANGISFERLDAFGLEYRYIARYLQNQIDKQTMIDEITVKSRQYAKRQKTWLKRNPSIIWLPFPADPSVAITQVERFLNTLTSTDTLPH